MKRAFGLSMAASILLGMPTASLADGLLSDIIKDTLNVGGSVIRGTGSVIGGTVNAAGTIVGGTVGAAGSIIGGTVDGAGNVIDGTGHVIGRVLMPGDNVVTTPGTVIRTNGDIVTIGSANDVYAYSIDARRYDLRRAVKLAQAQSKITDNQANELQDDLNRIRNNVQRAKASDDMLTFDESINLGHDLDKVNVRLANAIHVQPLGSLIVVDSGGHERMFVTTQQTMIEDSPFVSSRRMVAGSVDADGNILDIDGSIIGHTGVVTTTTVAGTEPVIGTNSEVLGQTIDLRLAALRRTVDANFAAGKMSPGQCNNLRNHLDRIVFAANNARSSADGLTFDKALLISSDLDQVNSKMGEFMNVAPFQPLVVQDGAGHSRVWVHKQLSTVADPATGAVTTTTTTSSNTVVSPMAVSSDALVAVLDARRYELDRMVGNALMTNTMNQDRAASIHADLSRIASELDTYRFGTAISSDKAALIAQKLDALSNGITESLKLSSLTALSISDATSTRIVSDQFGNVIALQSATPNIFVDTIQSRRAQLENQIAGGLASGTLTASQAAELRAELDRVSRAEARDGTTTFTYVNALPLAVSLDYVGNQLRTYAPTIVYSPLIEGSRFFVIGGRVVMLDDVMVRRAELESRISREHATGRLSNAQTSVLRNALSKLAHTEAPMRAKGGLTYEDSRLLYQGFDKIGASLDHYTASSRRSPISSNL